MISRLILALPMLVALQAICSLPCAAQDWARKMFAVTEHDFGQVASGAQPQFGFELENRYEEDVEIKEVRSSCGCTTPSFDKKVIKTWEKSTILATFNTKTFSASKSATITVVLSKPYYAEVQLQVSGYIRNDIALKPGFADFGSVDQGQVVEQRVVIAHAGKPDWEIVDVRSANRNLEVELAELQRTAEQVRYEMIVRLKATTEPGYFQDELSIISNEGKSQSIALPVRGRILSPLTISPGTLFLGVLKPGQQVAKQLVVRAAKPFRVLDVECQAKGFSFDPSDEPKKFHVIRVTYHAGVEPGKVAEKICIHTDLGENIMAHCMATGNIESQSR